MLGHEQQIQPTVITPELTPPKGNIIRLQQIQIFPDIILALSPIYTHFNTLKKKLSENIVEKLKLLKMSSITNSDNTRINSTKRQYYKTSTNSNFSRHHISPFPHIYSF